MSARDHPHHWRPKWCPTQVPEHVDLAAGNEAGGFHSKLGSDVLKFVIQKTTLNIMTYHNIKSLQYFKTNKKLHFGIGLRYRHFWYSLHVLVKLQHMDTLGITTAFVDDLVVFECIWYIAWGTVLAAEKVHIFLILVPLLGKRYKETVDMCAFDSWRCWAFHRTKLV